MLVAEADAALTAVPAEVFEECEPEVSREVLSLVAADPDADPDDDAVVAAAENRSVDW